VVKATVNEDLAQADCWGPHHEIRDDGRIVLNRAGLIATAAALAGARSEPNLTPLQKRQAARHLLRHYRELELEPPESLMEAVGEISSVQAVISGEMQVEDVPLASWADLQALKAGDPEPMEVVVEIPAGKSRRGWNYTPEALKAIAGEVMEQGLPGFLGHQKPENIDHEFPTPVTHWVGALWKDGKAYFRGVIDKAASDLKRWIKAKAVRQVSIFGVPKLQQVGGETHVVNYKPLSIDWTPLNRAGMPTSVVAIGEMDEILLTDMAADGEMKEDIGGEQKTMNWKELVAQLKTMLANKEVTLGQIAGEMGWNPEEIAGEIDSNWLKEVTEAIETLGKVKEALGVTGEMDVVAVAKASAEAAAAKAKADHEAMVAEVLKEKVKGEMAQGLVMRMLQVPAGATKEQVAGEIDKLLADEKVKAAIDRLYTDAPLPKPGVGDPAPQNIKVIRAAI
jgi:predicted transcriptional regulator